MIYQLFIFKVNRVTIPVAIEIKLKIFTNRNVMILLSLDKMNVSIQLVSGQYIHIE